MTIITTIEIEVEADCDFYKGTDDHFNKAHGNWLPGDPPEIKKLKVYLRKSNACVDITDALTGSAIDQISGELLEEAARNEGDVA